MSQSNRHIAYVSPLPPPVGGIATWTETIQNRGLGDGWRISIINSSLRSKNITDQRRNLVTEAVRTLQILFSLIWILIFKRPNVVHVNCSLSERGVFRDALVAGLARVLRVSVVANLNGNFLPGSMVALSRRTEIAYRFLFRRSQQIVALSDGSRLGVQHLGNFDDITIVMPCFIDFSNVPEKSPSSTSNFKIGYLGALLESKGLGTIYETALKLPEHEFVLVGDIRTEAESDGLIRQISDLPNVTLAGSMPHFPALEIIASCNALLFPSHSEGFPLAVVEAMAIGLPVVASPVGAIPEIIDTPDGGYLIQPNDIDGYVAALKELSADPNLASKIGAHSKDKARALYAYKDVIARWRDLYISIS